jgi:hypothetical protein
VFPPTLVKEDEALSETADCRMVLTVVLRWATTNLSCFATLCCDR